MPPLREYLEALWERRAFMAELARAGVRGKRSSTLLGGLWAILDPLFQVAIYYLLFTTIRKGGRPIEFLHVLVANIFLFRLVTASILEGGNSIRQSQGLILNSMFPRALLPITVVYKGVLQLVPAIGVYLVFHLVLGAPVGPGLVFLPLLFGIQVVWMVGAALLTSTAIVYFKDAKNVIGYVSRILFFTAPIIFPLALIPDKLRALLMWQPVFGLFAGYQEILRGDLPSAGSVLSAAAWAAVLFVVGGRLFLRNERNFAIHL
jgi:ABC-type polysaccharide/polyol phosphate export permease